MTYNMWNANHIPNFMNANPDIEVHYRLALPEELDCVELRGRAGVSPLQKDIYAVQLRSPYVQEPIARYIDMLRQNMISREN